MVHLCAKTQIFQMFDLSVCIGLIMIIFLLTAALILTKKLSHSSRVNSNMCFENLINVWNIFCQQGLPGCLFILIYWLKLINDSISFTSSYCHQYLMKELFYNVCCLNIIRKQNKSKKPDLERFFKNLI